MTAIRVWKERLRDTSRQATEVMLRDQVVRCLPVRDSRTIALTFDDGPHPENTPRVLDALAHHRAKATFFLIGERVSSYPELTRRIVQEGHTIGCHTLTHPNLTLLPFDRVWQECRRGKEILEATTGGAVRLFRPPMGWLKLSSLPAVLGNHMRLIYWNWDSEDYTGQDASATLRRVTESPPVAGDILLFHDTLESTANVLPSLLEQLDNRGLESQSLQHILTNR